MALMFMDYIDPECVGVTEYEQLGNKAKEFIEDVERRFSINVSIVGTGGEALSTIRRREEL